MLPLPDALIAPGHQTRLVGGLFWRITALALLVPLALLAASGWWTWRNLSQEAEARVERMASTLEEHARRLIAVQETLLGGALARVEGLDWEAIAGSTQIQTFLAAQNRLARSSQAMSLMRLDTAPLHRLERGPNPCLHSKCRNRDYAIAHRSGGPETLHWRGRARPAQRLSRLHHQPTQPGWTHGGRLADRDRHGPGLLRLGAPISRRCAGADPRRRRDPGADAGAAGNGRSAPGS